MKLLDINIEHELALVEYEGNEIQKLGLHDIKFDYVPLNPGVNKLKLIEEPLELLRQHHYIARHLPTGLTVTARYPKYKEWQRLDTQQAFHDKLRGL